MRLSVIMAILNSGDTIETQLKALANQVWSEPWEVIISDNGSTDDSIKIVEKYKDQIPNLRIVDSSDRRGHAHALNIGIEASIGESLAFCDGDDEVGPGWLAALGKALSKYDFVACRTDIEKLNSFWVQKSRGNIQQEGIQKFNYPDYLPHAGAGTIALKQWIHEAIGGFNESLTYLHDTDYCWRIQLLGIKLYFVPDALVHIRFRNNIRDIYLQAHSYGKYNVMLYKKYQQFGMPKISWKQRMLKILGVIKCLLLIRDTGDIANVVWFFGWYMGRLKGSINFRMFAL